MGLTVTSETREGFGSGVTTDEGLRFASRGGRDGILGVNSDATYGVGTDDATIGVRIEEVGSSSRAVAGDAPNGASAQPLQGSKLRVVR
jgi:hypothetical protein